MKKAVLAKKSKKKKKEKDGFFKQAGKVLKKAAKKTALAAKSLTGANLKETLSAVVDFIPVVGNAKAAVEVITGGDPITGRKLDDWERVAAGAAMVGGAVVKGAVRTGKVVSAVAGGGKAAKKSTKSKKSEEKPKVPEKVASDVVSRVEKVVDKAVGNSTSTSKKSRSAPADTGTPNSTKVDRDTNGNITKYTTYGSDGKIVKEVRIDGKDHGSIPRPNVEEPTFNTNPKTGEQFQNGYEVRPVDPDEIPNSRK
nr:pre-toxin TG domain-containing protein [Sporosarcina limicola]